MGIISRLLGNEQTNSVQALLNQSRHLPPSAPHIVEGFLDYSPRHFFGPCSTSPNGRYAVAWLEGYDSGGRTGVGTGRSGRCLLFEDNRLLVEGSLERPNDGKVADNGTFVLNDWEFGDGLKGTFYAFAKDGRPLIARKFKVNLFNNGLSPDGRFAVCQSVGADSPNGGTLTIFDLVQRTEIGCWCPQSPYADYYEFTSNCEMLGMGYRKFGCFRYSFTGEFINREVWQDAWLTKGDYGETLAMVERLLKSIGGATPADLMPKLMQAIDRVSPMLVTADARDQALALKLLGMCLENQGCLSEALAHYDKALAINPKVGVKLRADRIRKALSSPLA